MTFFRIPPSGNAVPFLRLLKLGKADFRQAFSSHCGFSEQDIFYTGSGTGALYLALLALKRLHPGRNEVVLPAWCCPSVPQAVLQAGLKPVQVDLNPDTFAYPPKEVAMATSDRTLTILLVHYFGIFQPKPDLKNPPPLFLRDCAQDFDFHNLDEPDCAAFYSFGRGKSLNTGHGGALCLPNSLPKDSPLKVLCREILETLPEASCSPRIKAILINVLSHPIFFGVVSSLPFLTVGETLWESPLRFTRIHPGFFRSASACWESLETSRDGYAILTQTYIELLSVNLKIHLPVTESKKNHLPVRFPLRVTDSKLRENLRKDLNRKFGGVTGQYPDVLSRLPGVPREFPKDGFYPGCEKIAAEILTFPVTAWFKGKEDAFVGETRTVLKEENA